jgi:hypothetical protein
MCIINSYSYAQARLIYVARTYVSEANWEDRRIVHIDSSREIPRNPILNQPHWHEIDEAKPAAKNGEIAISPRATRTAARDGTRHCMARSRVPPGTEFEAVASTEIVRASGGKGGAHVCSRASPRARPMNGDGMEAMQDAAPCSGHPCLEYVHLVQPWPQHVTWRMRLTMLHALSFHMKPLRRSTMAAHTSCARAGGG